MQMTDEPTREDVLDLLLTDKEKLLGHMKVKGRLGCSDQKLPELKILTEMKKRNRRITALDFKRTDFSLFRYLLSGRLPWKAKEPRTAGWSSRTTFSKHSKCPFQHARS